jgi:hypothetical protein
MKRDGPGRGYPIVIGGIVPDIAPSIRFRGLASMSLPGTAIAALQSAAQSYWEAAHFAILAPRSNDVRARLRRIESAAKELGSALEGHDAIGMAATSWLELENHTSPMPQVDVDGVRLATWPLASAAQRAGARFPDSRGGKPQDYGLSTLILTAEAILSRHKIRPTSTKDPGSGEYRGTLYHVVDVVLRAVSTCARREYGKPPQRTAVFEGGKKKRESSATHERRLFLLCYFTRKRSNSSIGNATRRARRTKAAQNRDK